MPRFWWKENLRKNLLPNLKFYDIFIYELVITNQKENIIVSEINKTGEMVRQKQIDSLTNAKNIYEESNGYYLVSEKKQDHSVTG